MSSKIRVLDEHTINKIAAGEVIENPASVIKELVENALDAGSTDICVEIKGGGRQLIRITDNGCGMNNDDALLCLERHATSKIRAVEDIHELFTMGFRGEAVPSIAAISKFSIITRQKDSENPLGTMVLVEGGKILKCCPVACSPGTTIEVKSLFFNIPVRKKFQKSPAHDANEILKMLTLIALGHPHIKFRLICDQETTLSAPLPTGNGFLDPLKERIGTVLGGDYVESCVPLESKLGDYLLQGWIGTPYQHRQNRTGQYLFINQRGIQSPLVSFAVKDGYGTTIPAQRHPIYVLHLTMPGNLVDVNVHPQKREVRLRQEMDLREMVVNSVREAIQKTGGVHVDNFMHAIQEDMKISLPIVDETPSVFIKPVFNPLPLSEVNEGWVFANSVPAEKKIEPSKAIIQELTFEIPPLKRSAPKVIACIPRYLILEAPPQDSPTHKNGLCLVDQRAAHARTIYEKLCRHRKNQPTEIQQFLIPHTIELPPIDALKLKESLPLLESLGIHLKEFGRHAFLLDGLPEVMGNVDPTVFVQEIVCLLNTKEETNSFSEQLDRRIAMAAVRASVSKDRRLSITEGQALIHQLFACETPWYCPQGKPTLVTMTPEEISKHFS